MSEAIKCTLESHGGEDKNPSARKIDDKVYCYKCQSWSK